MGKGLSPGAVLCPTALLALFSRPGAGLCFSGTVVEIDWMCQSELPIPGLHCLHCYSGSSLSHWVRPHQFAHVVPFTRLSHPPFYFLSP